MRTKVKPLPVLARYLCLQCNTYSRSLVQARAVDGDADVHMRACCLHVLSCKHARDGAVRFNSELYDTVRTPATRVMGTHAPLTQP